jgi:hypothetical protein
MFVRQAPVASKPTGAPAWAGFGLGAAASWGSADFCGGIASRRANSRATAVPCLERLAVIQVVGIVAALVSIALIASP